MELARKQIKKLILCVGLLLFVMQLFSGKAYAAVSDDTTVDFVLVLDYSGSMDGSDTNKLSMSAAKMFIDMLPAENARLAVVMYGPDYGSEAYPTDKTLKYPNRIKEAFPLQSITELQQKDAAKEVIDTALRSDDAWTQVGYALEVACEILEEGGTSPDSASIILLSDGRVSGQDEDVYDEAYEYKSIDAATEKAYMNGWPIYCLELNYDHVNAENANDWKGKVGYHQMRQIAEKTNAAHIEMTSPTEAQNAFSEIFAKFFDADPTVASGTIANGQVALDFEIGEMIAETNLTITQKLDAAADEEQVISLVDKIVITNPDGKETVYENKGRVITEDNKVISFGDMYITAKLMTPKSGKWTITAYGTDNVEIGLYAVSIREMNLQLSALTDRVSGAEGMLPKGCTVDFSASYIYNGGTYSSDTFYKESNAYLVVEETGERVEMTGGTDNYQGSLTFNNSGTYTVKAYVESDMFRNDRKESGSYTFTVGNLPLTLSGTISDVEMNVGGTHEIDCTQYFKNEDNDKITYKVTVDQTADINYEISESGIMTLKAGEKAGSYSFTISANDGGMDQDIEQKFNVTVVNQPLEMIGENEVSIVFTFNADSIPGFVQNACKIGANADAELFWSDYFNDPDGLPIDFTITAVEDDGTVTYEQRENSLYVAASAKGKAVYNITAADRSDASVAHTLTVKVESLNAVGMVWQKIKVPVFIIIAVIIVILVLIIYAMVGRKIYGKWDVITLEKTVKDRNFGVTGGGKHPKCSMNRLLKDLSLYGDFPGVEFVAGNNLNKKVIIRGFDKVNEVVVSGSRVTDPAKLKKLSVTMTRGKSVTIISASGAKVKLERKA